MLRKQKIQIMQDIHSCRKRWWWAIFLYGRKHVCVYILYKHEHVFIIYEGTSICMHRCIIINTISNTIAPSGSTHNINTHKPYSNHCPQNCVSPIFTLTISNFETSNITKMQSLLARSAARSAVRSTRALHTTAPRRGGDYDYLHAKYMYQLRSKPASKLKCGALICTYT